MNNEQEDDQLMQIYRNTTTNFAQGASTPTHSDTGRGVNSSSSNVLPGQDSSDQNSLQSVKIQNNYPFMEEYKPESKLIDMQTLHSSDKFRKKRYVDALFFGDISNMKRTGKGIMKYKSGRLYEGDWLNDIRHGTGYEKYANGNVYLGDFESGKAHGQGAYTWKTTGEVYVGEWFKGYRHGYGVWSNVAGDRFEGQWEYGRAKGRGVFIWINGDKYEGLWNLFLKEGQGNDTFANQDTYKGEYKKGKAEGYGVYTWSNGSQYEGMFLNGLKHGKGKWRKGFVTERIGDDNSAVANSNSYNGDYAFDKKNGYGEFQWGSGNRYKGEYKDDARDGHGEMLWSDGSRYIGEWRMGNQNGYGQMIFPDRTIKEGYFKDNVFIGLTSNRFSRTKDYNRYQTPRTCNNDFQQKFSNTMSTSVQSKQNKKQTQMQFESRYDVNVEQRNAKNEIQNFKQNKGTITVKSKSGLKIDYDKNYLEQNNEISRNQSLLVPNFYQSSRFIEQYQAIQENQKFNPSQLMKSMNRGFQSGDKLRQKIDEGTAQKDINKKQLNTNHDRSYDEIKKELNDIKLSSNNDQQPGSSVDVSNSTKKTLHRNMSTGVLSHNQDQRGVISNQLFINASLKGQNIGHLSQFQLETNLQQFQQTNANREQSPKQQQEQKSRKQRRKKGSIIARSQKGIDIGKWGGRGGGMQIPYGLYAARLFETSLFQTSNYNMGMA